LPGLISRLDHLSWIGIGAVWLSPIYPSPMADFGYDVANFRGVDRLFGNLTDLDHLVEQIHRRGMRLLLDFVANHTSALHPWFVESRSSLSNTKRDWYIWADPRTDGSVPNNWLSRFGGTAWEFDPPTGQYYYHSFLKEQPDLNWRNPAVRAAMADVLRFWMRRGIDGFRIDAAGVLIKDELLRDEPPNPKFHEGMPLADRFARVYTDSRPEAIHCLTEIRAVVDEFPDRVLLGEVDTGGDHLADFYGRRAPCLDLPLNYGLRRAIWNDSASLKRIIDDYLGRVPPGRWPCWASGCHDMSRFASRVGLPRARAAAMLLFCLPGTTLIYAGDEIGLTDVSIPSQNAKDELERRNPGYGLNRDPYRTPMHWDRSRNSGFTSGRPWLPVGEEASDVESERRDHHSLLALYRRLIALKKMEPILQAGTYNAVSAPNGAFAFRRSLDDEAMLVALNFSDAAIEIETARGGTIALSTNLDKEGSHIAGAVKLGPYEGLIVRLSRGSGDRETMQ
jgi:alpha-glucosidase